MADKEYIEREVAKNAIFDYICGHTMSKFPSKELLIASKKGAEGAFNELDYVPTADVAEVKHGEWKPIVTQDSYLEPPYCDTCKCSVCEYEIDVSETVYKYCPNCGAKMDGGKNDKT
jgi:hypothetical protein